MAICGFLKEKKVDGEFLVGGCKSRDLRGILDKWPADEVRRHRT